MKKSFLALLCLGLLLSGCGGQPGAVRPPVSGVNAPNSYVSRNDNPGFVCKEAKRIAKLSGNYCAYDDIDRMYRLDDGPCNLYAMDGTPITHFDNPDWKISRVYEDLHGNGYGDYFFVDWDRSDDLPLRGMMDKDGKMVIPMEYANVYVTSKWGVAYKVVACSEAEADMAYHKGAPGMYVNVPRRYVQVDVYDLESQKMTGSMPVEKYISFEGLANGLYYR